MQRPSLNVLPHTIRSDTEKNAELVLFSAPGPFDLSHCSSCRTGLMFFFTRYNKHIRFSVFTRARVSRAKVPLHCRS